MTSVGVETEDDAAEKGPNVDSTLQTAQNLLEALQKQDFEAVRQCLIFPLRLALSAKRLAELCNQLSGMTGSIETISQVQYHTRGYFPTIKALVIFQRATYAVLVRVGPMNSVISFILQPPVAVDLPAPWTVPTYVDEQIFTEKSLTINPFWLFKGIQACLAVPKIEGKKPAVLFLQGSGIGDLDTSIGSQKPAKDFAWGLASKGIVVLRVGKPLGWLLYKQQIAKNITADDEYLYSGITALKLLAKHPEVDASRVFIAGISMGGRYAPRLCQQSPIQLAGIISIAGPSVSFADALISQSRYCQKHFPKDEKEFEEEISQLTELSKGLRDESLTKGSKNPIVNLPLALPLTYFLHDKQYSPFAVMKSVSVRILVMQGMLDWQVQPVENIAAWREAVKDHSSTVKTYANLSHTFVPTECTQKGVRQYDSTSHVAEEVISDMVQWINQDG